MKKKALPLSASLGLKMTYSKLQTWSQGRESTVLTYDVIKLVKRIYDLRDYLRV